jgi:hypothetical protein
MKPFRSFAKLAGNSGGAPFPRDDYDQSNRHCVRTRRGCIMFLEEMGPDAVIAIVSLLT